jgi:tetratricopeptide (TPR) repeat protein
MHIKILPVFWVLTLHLSAQTGRIDSLKKLLRTENSHGKVDCLNAIAGEYVFYYIRTDSALKYARLAYQQASAIHYNSGMAAALLTQGDVQGRLLDKPEIMEQNGNLAIQLLSREKDPVNLSMAYYKLAIAYNMEGKHELALEKAQMARQISTIAGDKRGLGWAAEITGLIYCHIGEYWKSFENLVESQQIGKEVNDSLLTSTSLAFIGRCFNRVGDPRKALEYYHQSLQYATPFLLLWPHVEDMSYAYLQLKQYDSVIYYQQLHRQNVYSIGADPVVRNKFSALFWGNSVEVELARGQYDEIISTEIPLVKNLREKNNIYPLMQSLLVLAKAYQAKGKTRMSVDITRQLLAISSNAGNKPYLKEANQLMASLFEELKRPDSAYFYFRNYIAFKEAIDTAQFAQRTALYAAASESENRIRLLNKDKQIKEQELDLNRKELAKQGQLRNILLISLVMFVLLSVVIFRNNLLKRKNEQLKHEQDRLAMKRKALELEMQALRAQMNPHFIFNCLSAIDNLMQTNQADKATSYLARFAGLIRGVLESSKNNLVPFQKDFETLKLYLEMEQFRCNNKFSYSLYADAELLDGDYKVPPLIIQPFVENAIHHGLLNKLDTNRQLKVWVNLEDEHIVYSVTDNGVGRTRAAILKQENKPEHQSYGIAITRERIQLHNGKQLPQDVLITDLEQEGIAAGTNAIVRINSMAS